MKNNVQALTREDLAAASEAFRAERANLVAKNAVSSKGIRAAARVPGLAEKLNTCRPESAISLT